jgi:hypothetical protein
MDRREQQRLIGKVREMVIQFLQIAAPLRRGVQLPCGLGFAQHEGLQGGGAVGDEAHCQLHQSELRDPHPPRGQAVLQVPHSLALPALLRGHFRRIITPQVQHLQRALRGTHLLGSDLFEWQHRTRHCEYQIQPKADDLHDGGLR